MYACVYCCTTLGLARVPHRNPIWSDIIWCLTPTTTKENVQLHKSSSVARQTSCQSTLATVHELSQDIDLSATTTR